MAASGLLYPLRMSFCFIFSFYISSSSLSASGSFSLFLGLSLFVFIVVHSFLLILIFFPTLYLEKCLALSVSVAFSLPEHFFSLSFTSLFVLYSNPNSDLKKKSRNVPLKSVSLKPFANFTNFSSFS